jgi:hypothetical protein
VDIAFQAAEKLILINLVNAQTGAIAFGAATLNPAAAIAAGVAVTALIKGLLASLRSQITGAYTGATTYTAAAGYANAWTPANGMRLGGVLFASTKTSATGDGGLAGSPSRISGTARLVAWDSQLAIADFGHEYDVWHDGRLFGRFIARDVRRVPLGRLRNTTTVSVEIDALEVA